MCCGYLVDCKSCGFDMLVYLVDDVRCYLLQCLLVLYLQFGLHWMSVCGFGFDSGVGVLCVFGLYTGYVGYGCLCWLLA